MRRRHSATGRPTDSAHMESLFHSMKADAIQRCGLFGEEAYARAIGRYVPFYNQRRLHSGLGYVPLAGFETRAASPDVFATAVQDHGVSSSVRPPCKTGISNVL